MKKFLLLAVLLISTVAHAEKMDIELKDASLFDTATLLSKAGNFPVTVDESARTVNIGSVSLTQIEPKDALRQLATQQGYVFRYDNESYVIEKRRSRARWQSSAQFAPSLAEEKTFHLLTVKHVYVGGIAGLFKNSGVISTEMFITPAYVYRSNTGQQVSGNGFGVRANQRNQTSLPWSP